MKSNWPETEVTEVYGICTMNRTYSLTQQQKPVLRNRDDKLKRKSDGYLITNGIEKRKTSPDNIQDFVKSTVCLKKEKTGLGISIIGGCDTHLGRVLVSAISPKGAAGKDGRLTCGDQIVSVNGNDLIYLTHDQAVQLLRLAKNPVRLTVYRENIETLFTNCKEPEKEFSVVLKKGINDNLGLGIYARRDGKGVFVTYLAPGSLAEACGLIDQGDRILKCNGKDMRQAGQQEAVNFFKNTFGEVRMLIGRTKNIEDVVMDLIEKIDSGVETNGKNPEFKEVRPRSRSDCMSMKSKTAEINKKPKPRTSTLNEIYDGGAGSTLNLLSHQPLDEIRYLNNVNQAYQEEAKLPKVIQEEVGRVGQEITKTLESELKSTLKKNGKKGARKKDHVSFEMSKVNQTKNTVFMYSSPEHHSATNL